MTIIIIPVTPPVPPLSPEELLLAIFNETKEKSTKMYQDMEKSHTELFNYVWQNSNCTIEQFLEMYGTDALKLFQVSSLIQQVLILTNPDYVPLQPLKPVYFNEDGSATTVLSPVPEIES